jgi:DNA-binding Xre family transcriptional regulator
MTGKLDYQWHLRTVMANAGMYSTSTLGPLLAERGINLSTSQVYRLVTEKPERLNLKVLMALLDILGCSMDDLVEPVTLASGIKGKRAVGGGSTAGVGDHRPKRARIEPPQS